MSHIETNPDHLNRLAEQIAGTRSRLQMAAESVVGAVSASSQDWSDDTHALAARACGRMNGRIAAALQALAAAETEIRADEAAARAVLGTRIDNHFRG